LLTHTTQFANNFSVTVKSIRYLGQLISCSLQLKKQNEQLNKNFMKGEVARLL